MGYGFVEFEKKFGSFEIDFAKNNFGLSERIPQNFDGNGNGQFL